jgi:imidazolonepropionase-like amidohydrolase
MVSRPETTLFANGLVIDGLGGHAERSSVLVSGDTIVAVGDAAAARRRDAARVIDLDGRTLLPGFVDTHAHPGEGDFNPDQEHEPLGLAALRTVHALQQTLYAGITTLRAAGSREYVDVDARDAIGAGVVIGPRLVCAGRAITSTGGHMHSHGGMEVDGVDAMRAAVRRQVKRGVDAIKLALSPGAATQGRSLELAQFSTDEVRAAVDEAHRAGLRVLTHAISLTSIRQGVDAGVDSIDHGCYLDEEQARRMKEQGIYYVPTFGPFYYYVTERFAEPWRIERAERVTEHHIQAFRLALALGVPIAMGSDCGMPSRFPNGRNALEYVLCARNGMPNDRVLVAATSGAATLLGLAEQIGSVEPGKQADLVVLDGNPLDAIETVLDGVALVMKGGTIVRNDLDGGRTDVDRHRAPHPSPPTPPRGEGSGGEVRGNPLVQ